MTQAVFSTSSQAQKSMSDSSTVSCVKILCIFLNFTLSYLNIDCKGCLILNVIAHLNYIPFNSNLFGSCS